MELTYTKHGDYYIPDLDIPAQEKVPVNRYGQMHGSYLKKNNRTAYNELLFSGRLNRYLAELGEQAEKMLALLTEQYAAAENITEGMKAADQMGWVRAMNSIRNRAEEVVLSELVYSLFASLRFVDINFFIGVTVFDVMTAFVFKHLIIQNAYASLFRNGKSDKFLVGAVHNGVKSYKTFTVVVIESVCVDKCNFVKVNHFQILLIPSCTKQSIQLLYLCRRSRNT